MFITVAKLVLSSIHVVGCLSCGFGALFSLAITLLRKSLSLFFNYAVALCVLCRFLTVSWVGFQTVVVAFPDHTQFFSQRSANFFVSVICIGLVCSNKLCYILVMLIYYFELE